MRITYLFLASAALLATACNAEKGATNTSGPEVTAAPVPAPNNGDWSTVVTKSAEGGFVMGNPNAKVKLVEFGSMTCPHCAEFEEQGGKALIDNYVKKGLVSWEFRNFVRDPFDMAATLLARCGGEASFFGMTRTCSPTSGPGSARSRRPTRRRMQGLQTMPPAQQFSTIADLAGLKTYASQRGVPRAKADQCLANEAEANQLVQMNSDAVSTYSIPGTPAFLINGDAWPIRRRTGQPWNPSSRKRWAANEGKGADNLRFRRLKLSGFKSFVEPAELRIEPGLTGVVGPNGCGKSNLLEAIRWVMGEGSPKSLRGGGMEDVIFAGTATRPARDFAEVSLLIERDGDEADNDSGGESEVTRRIERGAGSAYRIDGRDVRQKDVSLLFADAATGAHSPALVSQGRIGAVISAKPVERRMMLEEAAGISGLHARRKDAEQKLRATEANLQRLDELLTEQEARASALRRQARAAERYRALTDKIRLAEGKLIYARWADADRAAAEAAEEAKACEGEVARLQQAMQAAQSLQEQAAAALAERREAAVAARDAGRTLAHELATARAKRDTVVRRLAELERLAQALSAETAREVALKADAAKAIDTLDAGTAGDRGAAGRCRDHCRADRDRTDPGRSGVARGRGGAGRRACARSGDAGRTARGRGRAGSGAGAGSARLPPKAERLAQQLAGIGDGRRTRRR